MRRKLLNPSPYRIFRSLNFSTSTVGVGPKIAVVGAGPAGFYATQVLAKARPDATIDIYERLPVPFGLVRFGVAPDHPDVKNCISTFTKTAELPNVNFFGNTGLGSDISLDELRRCYNSVLLSYGAEEDRELGVPGEHLKHVTAARSLVSMYNGLPGYQDLDINLDTETVVVVGIGNVAVDVARMILTPVDILRKYDTTDCWLEKLTRSRVKRVVLVGRRGPLQVSFTIKELRELIKLDGTRPVFHPDQYLPIKDLVPTLQRPRKRLIELLVKTALDPADKKTQARWDAADKEWELKLLRSPVEFLPGPDGQSVGGVRLAFNIVDGEGSVNQTEETEVVETGLVLRSIGYKSVQAEPSIPFNVGEGVVPNTSGRVEQGLYTAGWLATGPRGVIIDTMNTAFKVAANIVDDLDKDTVEKPGSVGMAGLESSTSWSDWEKVDALEEQEGHKTGKLREKIQSVSKMLEILEK